MRWNLRFKVVTLPQGMVSVEAIKSRGRVKYTLVTVDVFDDKKDFILVEGNEQRLKVRRTEGKPCTPLSIVACRSVDNSEASYRRNA